MAAKIKKGDRVVVLTGKDKGRIGEVLQSFPAESKVLVQGVNIVRRHTKPSQLDPRGGIKEREAKIHVSNVSLIDPKDNKPTRVGFEERDGKKLRVSRRSGEVLDS